MADEQVLLKNAKGRYVVVPKEDAEAYIAKTAFDKRSKLPRIVYGKDDDHAKGLALAAGGEGEGVRGDAILYRTGDGLVVKAAE